MIKMIQKINLFCFSIIFALVCLSGCIKETPIRIGFAAQLTGKQADLGIHLRNGVELAVEEINAAGGINGRNIELLSEDDYGTPQGAREAEKKLCDEGVVAIIGHITSDQTLAGYEIAQQHGVLLLSATASTSVMTGIDDLFYRTVASTDAMGRGFASYIFNDREIKSVAIIYDEDNQSYSEPLRNSFTNTYKKLGGKVKLTIKFSSSQNPDYSQAVLSLKDSSAEAVLIIASPYDTAMITQTIKLQKWSSELFTSSWAQGDTLFETGGKTLEGMEMIVGFDTNNQTPEMQKFTSTYEQRFNSSPIFSSMEGYETMHLLAKALKQTNGSAENLGTELVGVQDYVGLTGPVKLDQYGDVVRDLAIQKIIDGKFVTIKKLDSSQP